MDWALEPISFAESFLIRDQTKGLSADWPYPVSWPFDRNISLQKIEQPGHFGSSFVWPLFLIPFEMDRFVHKVSRWCIDWPKCKRYRIFCWKLGQNILMKALTYLLYQKLISNLAFLGLYGFYILWGHP